jgi:hypothetical protein
VAGCFIGILAFLFWAIDSRSADLNVPTAGKFRTGSSLVNGAIPVGKAFLLNSLELVKNLTRHCERFFMPAALEVGDDPALNPQVVKTLRDMPFGLRQMRPKRSSILHESAPVRSRGRTKRAPICS